MIREIVDNYLLSKNYMRLFWNINAWLMRFLLVLYKGKLLQEEKQTDLMHI